MSNEEIKDNPAEESNQPEAQADEGLSLNAEMLDAEAEAAGTAQLELNELKEQAETFKKDAAEWNDKYFRKAAEFENYKRRTEQEQLNLLKYAGEQMALKILTVVDDFERSMQHTTVSTDPAKIIEGIKLIYDKFVKVLGDQGIQKFESVGKPFDVAYHDALLQQDNSDFPPHTVIQEIQAGYMYKDRIIRHAQVIVSSEKEISGPETPAAGDNTGEGN